MGFTTTAFFAFFAIILIARWIVPERLVRPLLLVASYAFCATWGLELCLLVFVMSAGAYLAGNRIAHGPEATRKRTLTASIVALLSVLAFYKYSTFLVRTFVPSHAGFHIALPLGISFYTFEMVSYVVDVYRWASGRRGAGHEAGAPPAESLADFLLYIAYFPHLVAGPIVRAQELLPQLREKRRFSAEQLAEGMFILLVGLVAKVVFADNLAKVVDPVFATPDKFSWPQLVVGVVSYAGQIFSDFWGYTSIARGASLALGFPLPENFDYPYVSESITEFWRRWHMTLSRWLRDYLYISLGGNRGGELATYRNLMLTMVLGGLWHGASWTFVAWGFFHGALLALHKGWLGLVAGAPSWVKAAQKSLPYRLVAVAVTFALVCIGWVFFRAESFEKAWTVLRLLAKPKLVPHAFDSALWARTVKLLDVLLVVHVFGVRYVGLWLHRRAPMVLRGAAWAAMLAVVYLFGTASGQFIYFYF